MAPEEDIHVAMSSCSLCRQAPTPGTTILDVHQNVLSVPACKLPCLICFRAPYPKAWFHAKCCDTLLISYEPSEKPTFEELGDFADATRPSWKCQDNTRGEIAPILEGLSSEYTRRIIQSVFRQDLFMKLPAEIRLTISELIAPCWYLNVLGESRRLIAQLRSYPETQASRVKLTQDIWVMETSYRGIAYVARLSNTPLKATGTSPVHRMNIPHKFCNIVISLDSVGLRGIQFMDNNTIPKPDGSPWYEILNTKASSIEVEVRCDKHTLDYSFTPKFHPWNIYSFRDKHRFDYLKLDAHVRGLVVCCSNGMMAGIHGFSGKSKAFKEFVDLMGQRTINSHRLWFYFPLNPQEFITGAWVRKFRICHGPASTPVLHLQTSLGRSVTFGPQLPTGVLDLCEYISLAKESDGPISGIFHDGLDPYCKYITEVGVTCSNPSRSGTLSLLPVDTGLEPPEVPSGQGSITTTWYMTKASLDGLVKVQVCRDINQSHQPVSGLLLFYSDEHVESLGQVRWEVDLSQEIDMPIYFEKATVDGQYYIKDIRSDKHDSRFDLETWEWQMLPRFGTIVWWFSRFADQITIYEE